MESKEYLSIKDFAAAAGVSRQTIYNKLSKELSNFTMVFDNKKMIEKSALRLFRNEPLSSDDVKEESKLLQFDSHFDKHFDNAAAASNDIVQSLTEQLKEKDKQLEEKDKQIEKLLKINDQQQQLTLSLQKYMIDLNKRFPIEDYPEGEIMLAKEKQEEFDRQYAKVVEEVKKEKQELKDLRKYKEEHERKGFFKRLFRK